MANAESSNLVLLVGIATATDTEPAKYERIEPNSVTLSPNIETTQSAAIRAGRTPPEQIRTDADGRGDISQELQDKANEIFIEAAMQEDWGSEADFTVTDCDIAANGTVDDAGSANSFAGLSAGDTFVMSGWATDSGVNNGGVVVLSKASDNQIVVSKQNGVDYTVEANVAVTFNRNGVISVGSTPKWLWVEKLFDDGTGSDPTYSPISSELFKNARINTFDLSFTPGSIAVASMSLLGAFPTVSTSKQFSTATLEAGTPYANKPLNGLDNVRAIVEDVDGTATELGDIVTELSFSLNNNVATDSVVGQFGAVQSRLGQAIVTGRLNAFLGDAGPGANLITKMLAETPTSLAWVVDDGSGGGYGFKASGVKFTTLATPVSGVGDVVLQQLEWNATGLAVTRING